MGKRSTKENKNAYQICREEAGLTREKASEIMEYISADRIEKIESEKSIPHPDEILAMAKCYKKTTLPNYYCSHICSIGQKYVPEIQIKDLSQIVLEMLATLNSVDRQKNRLIDITADGKISEDEFSDFIDIQNTLEKVSIAVDSLKLWVEDSVIRGKMDIDSWENAKNGDI